MSHEPEYSEAESRESYLEREEAAALDKSDLSDATQARPEDLGTCWREDHAGPHTPGPHDACNPHRQARPEDVRLFAAAARMPSSVLVSPSPLPHARPEGVGPVRLFQGASMEELLSRHSELAKRSVVGHVSASERAELEDIRLELDLREEAERAGQALDGAPGWDKATRSIVSLSGLNWAGGVLREIRAAMAQNEEMAREEIDALEHKLAVARLRLDRAQKPLRADAEFFERAISTYAQAHKAEILKGYGKAQSRRFPSGLKVAWRKIPASLRLRDGLENEEALLRWAKLTAASKLVRTRRPRTSQPFETTAATRRRRQAWSSSRSRSQSP